MKKIALVLTVFLVTALASQAFVDTTYMRRAKFLRNTGYSYEMSEMIDIVNLDPYREPYEEPKTPTYFLKRALNYIAPGEYTNLDFYHHDINYDGPNWKDF